MVVIVAEKVFAPPMPLQPSSIDPIHVQVRSGLRSWTEETVGYLRVPIAAISAGASRRGEYPILGPPPPPPGDGKFGGRGFPVKDPAPGAGKGDEGDELGDGDEAERGVVVQPFLRRGGAEITSTPSRRAVIGSIGLHVTAVHRTSPALVFWSAADAAQTAQNASVGDADEAKSASFEFSDGGGPSDSEDEVEINVDGHSSGEAAMMGPAGPAEDGDVVDTKGTEVSVTKLPMYERLFEAGLLLLPDTSNIDPLNDALASLACCTPPPAWSEAQPCVAVVDAPAGGAYRGYHLGPTLLWFPPGNRLHDRIFYRFGPSPGDVIPSREYLLEVRKKHVVCISQVTCLAI